MDGIEIRRMLARDVQVACKVIGFAFADNPNTLAVVGGDRAKAQRMMQTGARVAKLGRKCSHAVVAEEAGRIVGILNAAQWPHCQMGMGEKLRTAPAMIRVMGTALPRAFKMMTVWAKNDPRKRHWHIGPIGVDPELQGRGIGKAMLASFLHMVDKQGLPAYLETDVDRNVQLYEKFGFKVIAQEELLGVNNRFMWRGVASTVALAAAVHQLLPAGECPAAARLQAVGSRRPDPDDRITWD
jgi:ribosomal protein S18 acetylase RimI-like enzyme